MESVEYRSISEILASYC